MRNDLRYALRMLVRDVGSTTVIVFALALGIGVNTVILTLYKAMVARPLDGHRAEELVNVAMTRSGSTAEFSLSYADYEMYRDSVRSLSGLIAFRPARMTLTNAGEAISQRAALEGSGLGRMGLLGVGASNVEFAQVCFVSENYFRVLGVGPVQGRSFEAGSDAVLISENYWQRRFHGDPGIIGKSVHLNGVPVTVTGIMPHDFTGTGIGSPAFWMPAQLEPRTSGDAEWLRNRENRRYRLFGRLAPGFTVGQVQAEMRAIAERLRADESPQTDRTNPAVLLVWPGSIFPLPIERYGGLNLAILLTMAAAGMVLAVAAANAGGLQLARGRARAMELRTRMALGATRSRVVRQLLTEGCLIGLLSGGIALLVTWALLRVATVQIAQAMPVDLMTMVYDVTPDARVFAAVFAVSVLAGVLSGLPQALQNPEQGLASGSRASTAPVSGRRLQDLLVGVQVALSVVLLIAGSMFVRSAMYSLSTETGYDRAHLIQVAYQFPEAAKYTADRKVALTQQLRARLGALPGVTSATIARPPGGSARTAAAPLDGPVRGEMAIFYTWVQPDYFATLGVPILLGRRLEGRVGEVVLSESAARMLWPGVNPVGRMVRLGATDGRIRSRGELRADGLSYVVVGVARDTRGTEFDGGDSSQIFLPLADAAAVGRPILLRTESDPGQVMRAVDRAAWSVDPVIVATTSTIEEMLRQSVLFVTSSLAAAIASVIGMFGLLLALIGIYGTVSHIVVLRTREVGIRMAIGAQEWDVLGLILRECARPVVMGVACGMALASGVVYLLRGLLYGVNAADGVVFALVGGLFLVVALVAAYPPARRAMRVDPVVALRCE